jgi:hypothetical protein
MADVRASVARMCNVCPVRRTLYFYASSIKQAVCQGIRPKRDRRIRRWSEGLGIASLKPSAIRPSRQPGKPY